MDGVQENLRPTRSEKTLGALKAERAVKRITFDRTEANPTETLYVSVPKLNENEVIVSGSLALRFNIDLSGGHANNFLVDNVGRALVDKLVLWHHTAGNSRLRHLQDIRGSLPIAGGARQHAARWNPE